GTGAGGIEWKGFVAIEDQIVLSVAVEVGDSESHISSWWEWKRDQRRRAELRQIPRSERQINGGGSACRPCQRNDIWIAITVHIAKVGRVEALVGHKRANK